MPGKDERSGAREGVGRSFQKRRAPKQNLRGACFSFFGGAVGGVLGMLVFRHKTRHWYFWAVNLFGIAWQAALAALLLYFGV